MKRRNVSSKEGTFITIITILLWFLLRGMIRGDVISLSNPRLRWDSTLPGQMIEITTFVITKGERKTKELMSFEFEGNCLKYVE